jgi:hypothetical protein
MVTTTELWPSRHEYSVARVLVLALAVSAARFGYPFSDRVASPPPRAQRIRLPQISSLSADQFAKGPDDFFRTVRLR